jgi:hypothetical protein
LSWKKKKFACKQEASRKGTKDTVSMAYECCGELQLKYMARIHVEDGMF